VKGDHRRSELDEVEERVAPNKWVGRPHDRAGTALERPAALKLLQRKAERPPLASSIDTGDVRVEVELRPFEPEKPERDADQAVVIECARDEVSRVDECAKEARRRLRLTVVPDAAD